MQMLFLTHIIKHMCHVDSPVTASIELFKLPLLTGSHLATTVEILCEVNLINLAHWVPRAVQNYRVKRYPCKKRDSVMS